MQRALIVAALVLPVGAVFSSVLFADRSFAFRDTAHYHEPLFQWHDEQWRSGRIPLWNPHLNFGTPIAGDAANSLFYPAKLLFLLPLSFSWRMKLYVVGHVLLAAITAYWASRKFGVSRSGSVIAALSYALGGSVVFQHCNVIYLVGAAWLPAAMASIDRMVDEQSWRYALGLGIVLAMMTLGGDPQAAYHTLLAAAGYACAAAWSERKNSENWLRTARPLALFALATSAGLLLAAIQILPAMEAARRSDRSDDRLPRSIYEAATVVATRDDGLSLAAQGLFQQAEPDTHAAVAYDFSWGPWHLPEFVWPGMSGEYFPQYRRVSAIHPREPRMWTPSTYMGLLPIVLAVASLRFFRGTRRMRWLSWCAAIALLGSFGVFGLSWLVKQPLHAVGQANVVQSLPADPVGGAYWCMATFLPGYAYFRYPAKLLTFAACPLALLAGIGFDQWREGQLPRLKWALVSLASLSGVLLAASFVRRTAFDALTSGIGPDAAFGPFDVDAAYRGWLRSLLHGLVLAGVLGALVWQGRPRPSTVVVRLLLIATAVELVIAQAGLIGTAPSSVWRQRPLLATMLDGEEAAPRVRGPRSTTLAHPVWQATSSPKRLEEIATAERHAMRMHHALAGPIDSIDAVASLRLANVANWRHRRANLESLGENYRLVPTSSSLPLIEGWAAMPGDELQELTNLRLLRRREPLLRAFVVPGQVATTSRESVERLREHALADACQIVVDHPTRVVIEVPADAEGTLILCDSFFPGWQAVTESHHGSLKPVEIHEVDGAFRGVGVPLGTQRITFQYCPNSFYLGAAVSAVGWLSTLCLIAVARLKDLSGSVGQKGANLSSRRPI
jgi:hypothetical protein